MTTKSALFLIQTPLHVFNAREAMSCFDITYCTFVIVTSDNNQKWRQMIEQTLPDNANVIYCLRDDFNIERSSQATAECIRHLKTQTFDYVFFCDARLYIFTDIVNSLNHPMTYLMDDGTGILLAVDSLNKTGIYYDRAKSSSAQRQQLIIDLKKRYGLWDLQQTPYDLFTVFDFEPSEHFDIVNNPLNQLSKRHTKTATNDILILGQPFIRLKHLTLDNYLLCLRGICHLYPDKNIQYLPHPREDEEELKHITDHCDFTIISTLLTAEAFLLQHDCPPQTVTGFYSTSLWNIAKFQSGINVKSFRIPADLYNETLKTSYTRSSRISDLAFVDLVYSHFERRVDIHDL